MLLWDIENDLQMEKSALPNASFTVPENSDKPGDAFWAGIQYGKTGGKLTIELAGENTVTGHERNETEFSMYYIDTYGIFVPWDIDGCPSLVVTGAGKLTAVAGNAPTGHASAFHADKG